MNIRRKLLLALLGGLCVGRVDPSFAEQPRQPLVALAEGDVVWFAGDSTTVEGIQPIGYVTLIRRAIEEQRPDLKVRVAGEGGSGSYSSDLLRDIVPSVLSKQPAPTLVIINFGLNDSKSGEPGIEPFVKNMTQCVALCRKQSVRVALCTPTTWYGPKQTEAFAAAVRKLGQELSLPIVDLYAAHVDHLNANLKDGKLAPGMEIVRDGVHLTARGNQLSAATLLEAMGLKPEWKSYIVHRHLWAVDVAPGTSSITIEPLKESYAEGEKIIVTAHASDGFRFKQWHDAAAGSENPQTLTLTRHLFIDSEFEPSK